MSQSDPPAGRLNHGLVAVLRLAAAVLWLGSLGWKVPPDFGQHAGPDAPDDLYQWTSYAVSHPVLSPYTWIVEELVLPNFGPFAWGVLLLESALGAFLLVGLATRFWALVGIGQSAAIMLTVGNAPDEWIWSYVLMMLLHTALFVTAAGRHLGLDGVLRPGWQASGSRAARLLAVAS